MIYYHFAIIFAAFIFVAVGSSVAPEASEEKAKRVASQTMPTIDKPIVEGPLKGCVATHQDLYKANGDKLVSLWAVRCPYFPTTSE